MPTYSLVFIKFNYVNGSDQCFPIFTEHFLQFLYLFYSKENMYGDV